MSLLIPLGLLGLLGIVALILIYIIKPNYQQKSVSSTFVWKLSLKYKRKKIPISKLRNILLIICQILAIAGCAMILSKPGQALPVTEDSSEIVFVLDCSASMRTLDSNGVTRYEKAISEIKTRADATLAQDGSVSVILAEKDAHFLAQRYNQSNRATLRNELTALTDDDDLACTYNSVDLQAALDLCENVLKENRAAQVMLYTDTTYDYVPEDIKLVNMAKSDEYNVGILNVKAEKDEDTRYSITVEIANYGASDQYVDLKLELTGANAVYGMIADENIKGSDLELTYAVDLPAGETQKVMFLNESSYLEMDTSRYPNTTFYVFEQNGITEPIFSYDSIRASIPSLDNFSGDDVFCVYGGMKPALRVQYVSTLPNKFMRGALGAVQKYYQKYGMWNVIINTPKAGTPYYATKGYDIYIFEHQLPTVLPQDGVVILLDPLGQGPMLRQLGISIGNTFGGPGEGQWARAVPLVAENATHPLMQDIVASEIKATQYLRITSYDSSYETLMRFSDTNLPAMLMRDNGASKIVILPFSVHYSNFSLGDAPLALLMLNIMDYFFPVTVEGSNHAVGDTVLLNSRGSELHMEGFGVDNKPFTTFPAAVTLTAPGTYTFSQKTDFEQNIEENIFVRMPAEESNIFAHGAALESPERAPAQEQQFKDFIWIFAAVVVALLFAEWWLQSRVNNM